MGGIVRRLVVVVAVVATGLHARPAAAAPLVTATIDVGGHPVAIAVNEAAHRVYVADENTSSITIVNEETRAVAGHITLPTAPRGIAYDPAANKIFASGSGGNALYVVDVATGAVERTIAVGSSPSKVAFDPVGGRVFVVNTASGTVSVIKTADWSVTPVTVAGPLDVVVHPETGFAYVSTANSNGYVIQIAPDYVTQTIVVGQGPLASVALNRRTNKIWVATTGKVQQIDGATRAVSQAHCCVGFEKIGVNTRTNLYYALESSTDKVYVIDGGSLATIATVGVGDNPRGFGVNEADNTMYIANANSGSVSVIEDVVYTRIDVAPPPVTSATSASFTFSSSETGAILKCSLDGAPMAACTSPKAYGGLPEGAHEFKVQSFDGAGNPLHPTPTTHAWTIDLSPPETTILEKPKADTNETGATFELQSNELNPTFACSLDGGAFVGCPPTQSYSGLAQGPHSFAVRASDATGNTDPTPATWSWRVDTTPPNTVFLGGPSGTVASSTATFTFDGSETNLGFECKIDDQPYEACSSPHTYSNVQDGLRRFTVRAVDAAGNPDPSPEIRSWRIDTTPPATTITSAPPRIGNSRSVTFQFVADETGVIFECQLGSASFAPCTPPHSLPQLAEGEYDFRVRGTDAVGNKSSSAATLHFKIDITPPQTTIDRAPGRFDASTTGIFEFSSDELDAHLTCSIDGEAAPCTSPTSYEGLTAGSHEFRVFATDLAGNPDLSPAVASWFIDSSPPIVTLDQPARGSTYVLGDEQPGTGIATVLIGPTTVRAKAVDEQSSIEGYQFLVDGQPWTGAVTHEGDTYSFQFTAPTPRLYSIGFEATNGAGLQRAGTMDVLAL